MTSSVKIDTAELFSLFTPKEGRLLYILQKSFNLCERNMKVSLASVTSSVDEVMSKISSRNIIRRTFSFPKRGIRIFSSFADTNTQANKLIYLTFLFKPYGLLQLWT